MEKIPLTLVEHQEIIYDLVYTLDDFCRANNIRYFLAHGTLLGAIRHQGIIPWDDDADIMMERSEYERFLELIIANPIDGYEIYSIFNTKDYYYPFAKFGKVSTLLVEPFRYVPKSGIGINIDIFPIDGCPNDFDEAKKYVVSKRDRIWNELNFRFYYKNEYLYHKDTRSGLIWKAFYLGKYLFFRFPPILKRRMLNVFNIAKEYKVNDSKYYFSFWTFNGARNLHKVSSIENIIYVPFGKRDLPVPQDYHTILTEEYGDYMVFPADKTSTHQHGSTYKIIE